MLWGGLDKGSQEFIVQIRGWCQWHLHLSLCQFKRVKRVHSSSDGGRVMGVCLFTKSQMIHKSSLLSSEDSVNGLCLHVCGIYLSVHKSQKGWSQRTVSMECVCAYVVHDICQFTRVTKVEVRGQCRWSGRPHCWLGSQNPPQKPHCPAPPEKVRFS